MLVLKETLVAALESTQDPAKSRECDLGEQQRGDLWLRQVIAYLETGALPSDGSKARKLAVCMYYWTVFFIMWRGTKP